MSKRKAKAKQVKEISVGISDLQKIQKNLSLGLQHHNEGNILKARNLYRKVLKINPRQPDALHLLGLVYHQKGQFENAVKSIKKSIDVAPGSSEAYSNLGLALCALGRFDEATKCYHQAIAINPNNFSAYNNLGTTFYDLGLFQDAVESIRRAIDLNPDFSLAHNSLGKALHEQGLLDEALTCFRKSLALDPNVPEVHNNLGTVLHDQKKLNEAVDCFRAALALDVNSPNTHNNLGAVFHDMKHPDQAVACFQTALELNENFPEALNNLGIAYYGLGKTESAIECYHKALVIRPGYPEALNNLGNVLRDNGQLEEAISNYRMAIAEKPDYAEAFRHLAFAKKHIKYDDEIKAMEELFAESGISDTQRMHLSFGLGKAHEELKEFEKAFPYILTGNRIKRRLLGHPFEEKKAYFDQLKKTFNRSLFDANPNTGCKDKSPIFILGMMRSGTSLTEQILASHSKIRGAGELTTINDVLRTSLSGPDGVLQINNIRKRKAVELERMGLEYVEIVRKNFNSAKFITDKMPSNFLYIGLIKLILPNAKIIHCTRNPLDNCLSIFKNYFSAMDHAYAYDLEDLGRYYTLYRDLMIHWHEVLPGFIHDIQYEEMVADQETSSREILNFCGLEWEDACLNFHQTKRSVKTASGEQVRNPIYNSSIQSWQNYETQLAPLIKELSAS